MTESRVTGEYEYEDGNIQIVTETDIEFNITGESANRIADSIDAEHGAGHFDITENNWDNLARGSFR